MRKRHLVAIAFLTALNVLNYFDVSIISAVGPSMKRDLGLSDASFGLVGSTFLYGYILSGPFFGVLMSRFNRVRLLALSVAVWSISLASTGYVRLFALIVVLRIVAGVAQSAFVSMSPTLLDELVTARIKSKVFSIFYAAIPIGTALGFIYAGYMDERVGWPMAFLLAGLFGLVLVPLFLKLPQEANETTQAALSKIFVHHLKSLLESHRFMLTVMGYAAQTFALGGFAFWAPTYISRVLGYPLGLGNTVFGSILALTGFAGTLIGGVVADHWKGPDQSGNYLKASTLFTLIAIPFAFLALALRSDVAFFACMAVVEMAIFATLSPITLVFMRAAPFAARATAIGLSIFIGRLLGDASSIWLVGLISDKTSDLTVGMYILPAALVINLFLWLPAIRARQSREL